MVQLGIFRLHPPPTRVDFVFPGDDDEDGRYGADDNLDEPFDEGNPALESEAEVTCPYCAEEMSIMVDAGGGDSQEYVEDCQVCCRPWNVHVSFDKDGTAEVWLEAQG